MDIENQFLFVLQSTLTQDTDEVEKATEMFNQMALDNPEELALIHFKILSSTDNDSVRYKTLIFLGRFFCLIKNNQIKISSEISEFIQNSLFSLFQNERFTKHNFQYLAYDIYKCAEYYRENWPQLPELLFELITSNSNFSSSALNCLSDCISNTLIDTDKYFEQFCNYAGDSLLSSPESNLSKISSLLRLVYSLAKFKNYQPNDIFIALFDQIPNYLEYSFNCEDSCRIINDFLTNVTFSPEIFGNSYRRYFETFIKMISDPCYESLRNTSIMILSKLITSFSFNFKEESISIFDFYIECFNEETYELLNNSLYELSNLYGEDKEFAIHVFEYLQNNSPSPAAFICFASSFNGIQDHFSDQNLFKNLIEILSSGFESDDTTRKFAFICFRYVIKDISVDDSIFPITEIFDALKSAIQKEENEEIFLKEIQLLAVLLKKFSNHIRPIIGEIVEMIDDLIPIGQIDSQIELFQCYRIISMKLKEEFHPYSQNLVSKIGEVFKDPKQSEKIFFSVIEMIPLLKFSIDEEILNEFLTFSFNFIFSEVYDESGNSIDGDEYQSYIINFFLNCVENDTMCDSNEFIEKVVKITFQNSTFSIEKVDKDADLSSYFECQLFQDSDERFYNIVSNYEIERVQNSLKILSSIFKNKNELLDHFEEDRIRLVGEIFDHLFIFKNNSISEDIFLVDKLILPLLTSKDEFSQILNFNIQLMIRKSQQFDINQFIAYLADCIEIVKLKWKDDLHIVDCLYQITTSLFNVSYLQFGTKTSEETGNYENEVIFMEMTQINIALLLRKLFKNYPSIGQNYLIEIKNVIKCIWPLTIVLSDFAHFCIHENEGKSAFVGTFLSMKNDKNVIQLNSMYALSIICNQQCFDNESMSVLLKNFFENLNENEKNLAVFILLQVFMNYSSLFDFAEIFWQLFDSKSYLLPDFCIEYFAKSLFFFVSNFGDSIPSEKIGDLINVIQKVLEKKLDSEINDELVLLLENLLN